MDDAVLVYEDKGYLQRCLEEMRSHVERDLKLSFNQKTQIFPIRNGVDYLGFHFYLTENGKVIRKVRQSAKKRMKRKLAWLAEEYSEGRKTYPEIKQIVNSHLTHMAHGHTWHLRKHILGGFVLRRKEPDE